MFRCVSTTESEHDEFLSFQGTSASHLFPMETPLLTVNTFFHKIS